MRLRFKALLAVALTAVASWGAPARASHCGACAYPQAACCPEQCCTPCVRHQVCYQTVIEEHSCVRYRPVYQTCLQECRYTVCKTVQEQHCRECCYTVYKEAWEDYNVTRKYTVCKPCYEQHVKE